MQQESGIEKFDRDTPSVIRQTVNEIAAGITGLAASERKELTLSAGWLLQALVSGKFLSQFVKEWEEFCRKGRIKDDYASTSQSRACLSELLRYLDSGVPDEKCLDLMKRIFLVAAAEEVTDRESHLPQQFMQICRTLSAGEILVLSSVHRIAEKKDYEKTNIADEWLRVVSEASGLKYRQLVAVHEESLMRKRLLMPRHFPDESGVGLGKHFRLTDLGYELCTFLLHYDQQ